MTAADIYTTGYTTAYGADHPEMATRHSNLGTVLLDLAIWPAPAPTTSAP